VKLRKQTSAVGTANEVAASCFTETGEILGEEEEEEGRLKGEEEKMTQNFTLEQRNLQRNASHNSASFQGQK